MLIAIFASFFSTGSKVINHLPGLGVLAYHRFSGFKKIWARLLYVLVVQLFRHRQCSVIVQNSADYEQLKGACLGSATDVVLIRGSGVDCKFFSPTSAIRSPKTVALVARMISTKGIRDFVQAAAIIWRSNQSYRFLLVGDSDLDNSDAISYDELQAYSSLPNVEWLGQVNDIRAIWERASIACLPTIYPEGIPMSLLEAASCGRPIVATGMPGCLEIVKDGFNGLIVPEEDPASLAAALMKLLASDDLCNEYGVHSRDLVVRNFDQTIVKNQTLALYQSVIKA